MKKILALLFLLLTICGTSQIPTANLIAYYPFCGNANDASGNGLNGTVMGASLSNDRFGNINQAYTFNGSNNYISLPAASFVGLNVYSCSLWMRPTSMLNASNIAYCVGSSTEPYCIGINYNPTVVFTGCYNVGVNPVQSYVNSASGVPINNWVHVVATRDLSVLKLYVNGVLVQQLPTGNTNNQAVDYGTAPHRALLGARSTLANFFPGQIDDVRIYSTVLSQSDVTALYNEAGFTLGVNSGSICAGNSFTISPSGTPSYTISGGSAVVSPASSTNYTVTASNSQGCSSAVVSSVTVNYGPSLSVNSGTICRGQTFVIAPSGANSYTFAGGTALATYTMVPAGGSSYTLSGNTAIVSPVFNSSYTIASTNPNGCSTTIVSNVVVSICTGISPENDNMQSLRVYPNPSSGAISIEFDGPDKKSGVFILRDLQGKVLNAVELDLSMGTHTFDPELLPGFYLGELLFNGKSVARKPIVISTR